MKRWKGGQNSLFKIAFLFSWLMMLKRGGSECYIKIAAKQYLGQLMMLKGEVRMLYSR